MLDQEAIAEVRRKGELEGLHKALRGRLYEIQNKAVALLNVKPETPRMSEDLHALGQLATEGLLLRDEWLRIAGKL